MKYRVNALPKVSVLIEITMRLHNDEDGVLKRGMDGMFIGVFKGKVK